MRVQYAREMVGLDSTMAYKVLTEAFTINLHHLVGSHCDVKNESCPNQDNTMCAFAVIGVRDVGIQAKVELLRFGFGVDDSFCRSLIMYSRSDVRKFVQDTKSLQGNKSAELNEVLTAIRNAKNECWDYEHFVEDRTRLASAIRRMQKSTRKKETSKGFCLDRPAFADKMLYMSAVMCSFFRFKMKFATTYMNEVVLMTFFACECNGQSLFIRILEKFLMGNYLKGKGNFVKMWNQDPVQFYIMMCNEACRINRKKRHNKGSCTKSRF